MLNVKDELIKMAVNGTTPEENMKLALQVLKTGQQMNSEGSERFISEKEAVEFCGGINRATLFRWRKSGLRSYKVGLRRFYRKADLTDYIIQVAKVSEGN